MSVAVTFHSVTAMIPIGGPLADAVAFYRDSLGFTVEWQSDTMAGLRRDQVTFNLVQNAVREWAEQASFSLGVRGLDELYAQWRALPIRVGPLEVKAWGRREFHLIVSSGVCLQFYEVG